MHKNGFRHYMICHLLIYHRTGSNHMTSIDDAARSGFGALLGHAARLWRRGVDQRLRPFGLTEATWLPLVRIARSAKPMRQRELAASLSLDSSAVVRLVDVLQAEGLVERREDEDRRV